MQQSGELRQRCDVNEADLLEYMGADPATNVVGMYIEGPRDGRRFARTLREVAAAKPVVVWKGGLTPLGAAAASSHTGSLAGSLEVWAALLHQVGAVQVNSFEELLDTLAAFHFLPGLDDRRIGYVGAGGGNTVVAGDASYRSGLPLPPFSPETRARLDALLPPVGANSSNPVDVLAPMPSAESLKAYWRPSRRPARWGPSWSTASSSPSRSAGSCTTTSKLRWRMKPGWRTSPSIFCVPRVSGWW